ncbi:MAG: hypothetical protein HQK88_09545 [Nitrospirae bacterium]|nr:hypothetical protein [Nitrospirota bacterium]MBF0534154.1 hypothetical protein [Nitrospirota bacterium]MBF0617041.1 hypothetical protein [Nitrospirota bacterium]
MKRYSFLLKYIVLLLLIILLLPAVSYAGWTWTQQTGSAVTWSSVASSSNGTKLAATQYNNYIYTSTNSGATWVARTSAGVRYWISVASSLDGNTLVALENNGYIYTSANSGVTWTYQPSAGSRVWQIAAMSSDGTKQMAAAYNGYIYTSTDSGTTWTALTSLSTSIWGGVAMSSDGTNLVASVFNGYIYTSTNSGATWTQRTSAGSRQWYSASMSSDGTKLAAVVLAGYIYTSTDSGATWTQQTSAGSSSWYSIASSSDGTKLAAVANTGYIYTSTDSGVTWTTQTLTGTGYWNSIASSSDGTKLVAGADYLYTGVYTAPTTTTTTALPTYTVTETLTNVTTDKASPQTVNYGSAITFQFTPTSGYYITGVSGCGGTDPGTQTVNTAVSYTTGAVTGDCTVTATAAQKTYTVTETLTNVTTNKASPQTVNYGSSITFQFTPTSGYYITSVSGCGGTNPGTQTVNTAVSYTTAALTDGCAVTATAAQQTKTVTESLTNVTTDKASPQTVNYGSTITFQFTPASGYHITSVYGCSGNAITIQSADTVVNYTTGAVTSNCTVIATASNAAIARSYTWTQQTAPGNRNWDSIASSSDGTKLVAAAQGDYLYTSTDSGATWIQQTSAGRYLQNIVSSSDGAKLAAAVNGGFIYTSTDSGATWTKQTVLGSKSWHPIASSSDGTKLAVADFYGSGSGGYIYTSTDSGTTWTAQTNAGIGAWGYIASSSDGSKLIAQVNGVNYASVNSGVSWTQTNSGAGGPIASSSDMSKLVAADNGGYIWTSTDFSVTWTGRLTAGMRGWLPTASSSDGTKLAVGDTTGSGSGGYIYTSTDSGATWNQQTGAGARAWYSIASSSNGTRLAAVDYGGYIYTGVITMTVTESLTNVTSDKTSPQTVAYGDTITFQFTPSSGYYITSVSGCGGTDPGAQAVNTAVSYTTGAVGSDCTVTATTSQKTQTVTETLTNVTTDKTSPQTVNYGDTITFQFTPSSGYYITSVSGCGGTDPGAQAVNTAVSYTTGAVGSDCTVTATATQQTKTVTESLTNVTTDKASPQTVNYGSTITFQFTPSSGYYITGVSGCGGTDPGAQAVNTAVSYTTGAVTSDCTVTATATQQTKTVTESLTNVTTDKASPQTVTYGGTITFQFTPASGYHITSVSGCGGTDPGAQAVNAAVSYTTGAVTSDCTVTATASQNTWSITETLANVTETSGASTTVNNNATQTFTFHPTSGYYITSVSGCGGVTQTNLAVNTDATYTTGSITADCTVTASASRKTWTVTPSAGTGGNISPNTPQTVNYNSTTSFTVSANSGYTLSSVGGTCGGSLSGSTYTTSTITADCTVIANFSQNPSSVTYNMPYLSTNSSNPSYCMASNRSSQDLTVKFTVAATDNATPSGTTNTFASNLASKQTKLITFLQNTISFNNESLTMSDINNASLYGGFLTFTSTAVYTSGTEARCKSVLLECYQGTLDPKRLMTGHVCDNGY